MLLKKVYRAMWAHKRAYIACIFLIAVGITMLIAMSVASDGLDQAVQRFYEERRLADAFGQVSAIPISDTDSLRKLEGIREISCRTVMEVRAEVEGSDEIITLRLHSVDPADTMRLNDIEVDGLFPTYPRDIVVNGAFLEANGLSLSDPVTVFLGGKAFDFIICGTMMSPEYTYIAKSMTDVLPDNSGFGVAYITQTGMEQLTGRPGIANDVSFTFQPGYDFDDVQLSLLDALKPYGIVSLIPRKDLIAYAYVDLEISSLRSVSTSMPFVFIFMAVVVLYLMMKRVIEQERTQIGTLKAFGYSNWDLMLHYLCYGGIVGITGGLAGFAFGYGMSQLFLTIFMEFFVMPNLANHTVSIGYLFLALAIAIGGGLSGTFMGAYQVIHLNPAEAMKAQAPKPAKRNLLGKVKLLKYILNARGFMALRGMARNPFRSGFVVLCVSFAFSMLCVSGSMNTTIDKMIYGQFTDLRLYNVKVGLERPVAYGEAVEAAYAVPHITEAEGMLEIPVLLKHKHLSEGSLLTGVKTGSRLFAVRDTNTKIAYQPPTDGIIITNGIADKLNLRAGDLIYIASPLLDEDISIPVSRVIEQNMGSGCYLELGYMSALLGQPATANAIILNTDNLSQVREYFKDSQNTTTIEDKDTTLQKYRDMLDPYTNIFYLQQLMATAVAFAIIYNTATISLSERKREYATLRVLGLTTDEVCEIMNFEYWLLSIAGMVLGVPLAVLLIAAVNGMMDTTLFSMPTSLPMVSYVTGMVGCTVAILLSNRSAKKKIRHFDMVEVLKERD